VTVIRLEEGTKGRAERNKPFGGSRMGTSYYMSERISQPGYWNLNSACKVGGIFPFDIAHICSVPSCSHNSICRFCLPAEVVQTAI